MVDTLEPNALAPSPESTPYRLLQPMSTVPAFSLSPRSALPDLENLFGDATFQAPSTTQSDFTSPQWSLSTGAGNMPTTHLHQPSAADPQQTDKQPDEEDLGSLYKGLPRDAKIGIIVGIVVIVSLSLLGCGMCFLDCKRRKRKWKQRRESIRQAESVTLEMQMRNGQTEQHQRVQKGLWDHLRPSVGTEGGGARQWGDEEARRRAIANHEWEGREASAVGTQRSGSVASRSLGPQDQASLMSSVPSVISSTGVMPAIPQSVLDSSERR